MQISPFKLERYFPATNFSALSVVQHRYES